MRLEELSNNYTDLTLGKEATEEEAVRDLWEGRVVLGKFSKAA